MVSKGVSTATGLLLSLLVAGCCEGARGPSAPAGGSDASGTPDGRRSGDGGETGPDERPAPPPEPVDLLHAVPTTVSVSSVPGLVPDEAGRIADGALETAWCSAQGEGLGAYVEVEIPSGAEVTSIEMTSGYSKRTATEDLFLGNQRITRVRLHRDVAEVGRLDLDPGERGLQKLSVGGPAGRYRIEVMGLAEGTRPDAREVCISELRVLGRSAEARPGEHSPTFRLGLPSAPAARRRLRQARERWRAAVEAGLDAIFEEGTTRREAEMIVAGWQDEEADAWAILLLRQCNRDRLPAKLDRAVEEVRDLQAKAREELAKHPAAERPGRSAGDGGHLEQLEARAEAARGRRDELLRSMWAAACSRARRDGDLRRVPWEREAD